MPCLGVEAGWADLAKVTIVWTTATPVGIARAGAGHVLALIGQNRPPLVESNA